MVCEGERSEPRYLHALRDRLRLVTLTIKGTSGADPRTLVEMATTLSRTEERRGDAFDFVYCVFDRDAHAYFDQASKTARDRGIRLARSWPCFEFWLLLHFTYSRKPYVPDGRGSACDSCIVDLRRHVPNYSKGDSAFLAELWDRMDVAIANAQRAQVDANRTREPNPSTEMHELVAHLQASA